MEKNNCKQNEPERKSYEPKHHEKAVIKGIVVYESFRTDGGELWECLLQSMGKH